MTENKRFWSEYYSVGYYTEIVDNDKELADVPNPKKNLTIGEAVDLLNKLNNENKQLRNDCSILIQSNQNYRKENEQLKEQNRQLRLENGKLAHDLFWANKKIEEELK